MTILTKASSEKKPEKVPLPMADETTMLPGSLHYAGRNMLLGSRYASSDGDAESMVFNRPHFSCLKTMLLFLISVIVMMLGILGGYALYRSYAPQQRGMHYRALCDIPYNSDGSNLSYPRIMERPNDLYLNWRQLWSHNTDDTLDDLMNDNFFREEIELDTTDENSYAKIEVPDFKDGRHGRFMHDFKENQSAIIDTTANRCFIMPLDRETTLPPKSFMDLMQKMGSGYYNLDTDRVRRTYRVVTPPVTDFSQISERIANECFEMKVYKLEKFVSGVFKRSAEPIGESGKFAEFSGKKIVEFDLLNIADIERYEKEQLEQK